MIKDTFTHLPLEKKEKILYAAHSCFAKQGLDVTTVRDIVKAADIPRGSFYQYFDEVVDVFDACVTDMAEKKLQYMEGLLALSGQIPFIELYEKIMIQGIEFAYDYKVQALSVAQLFHSQNPSVQKLRSTMRSQGLSMFHTLIETDQSAGFMSPYIDPHVLAKVLYGFNERELIVWFEDGATKPHLIEEAMQFLTIIKQGIE